MCHNPHIELKQKKKQEKKIYMRFSMGNVDRAVHMTAEVASIRLEVLSAL